MNTMIKKLVVLSMLAFCSINLMAQSLEIKGSMKNVPDQTVVTLLDGMANKEVATANVVGGKFELKTTLASTGIMLFPLRGLKHKFLYLLVMICLLWMETLMPLKK